MFQAPAQPAAAPAAAAAPAPDEDDLLAVLDAVNPGAGLPSPLEAARAKVAVELHSYLKEVVTAIKPLPRNQRLAYDVSAWWKARAVTYPHLAHVARSLLSVQATSAASERLFSAAGLVSTKLRSSLSPDVLEACALTRDAISRGVDVFAAVERLREKRRAERRAKRQKGAEGAVVAAADEVEDDDILDIADEADVQYAAVLGQIEEEGPPVVDE